MFRDTKRHGWFFVSQHRDYVPASDGIFAHSVASGSRTLLFLYLSMVIFGLFLYQEYKPRLTVARERFVFVFLSLMAAFGYGEFFIKLFMCLQPI